MSNVKPIQTEMPGIPETTVPQPKKRGRPKGSKDSKPRNMSKKVSKKKTTKKKVDKRTTTVIQGYHPKAVNKRGGTPYTNDQKFHSLENRLMRDRLEARNLVARLDAKVDFMQDKVDRLLKELQDHEADKLKHPFTPSNKDGDDVKENHVGVTLKVDSEGVSKWHVIGTAALIAAVIAAFYYI